MGFNGLSTMLSCGRKRSRTEFW